MTKEKYEFLASDEDEAESELCLFIADVLEQREQGAIREFNRDNFGDDAQRKKAMEHYWYARAIHRAIDYVNDWKDSL